MSYSVSSVIIILLGRTRFIGDEVSGHGIRRKQHARVDHDVFFLENDDVRCFPDLQYGDSSGNSESDFGSGDDESPIGTQLMDYTELEHLQQHRRNGRRGGRRPQVEAGFGGEGSAAMTAGADDVMLGRGLLRRGSLSTGTQFLSPRVRMYSNAAPATGDRRMPHRSQRRSRPSQLRTDNSASPDPTSLQHGHRGLSNGVAGGSQRRTASRPSRKQGLWSNDDLQQALAAFDDGVSMRKAAVTYNIPYSTFREWCYGIRTSRKKGPSSVLKPAEEEELVAYLIQMCDRGFGLSPTALRMKVYEITQSRWTPFRNGIPGNGWMRCQRW